jgi:hypothetical protein
MSRGTAASHAGLSIPYTNCRDTQGDRGGALVFAQASNDGSSCKQHTHIGSVALQLLSKCSPEFNCLRAFFDVSRISRISRISRSSVECPLLAAIGSPSCNAANPPKLLKIVVAASLVTGRRYIRRRFSMRPVGAMIIGTYADRVGRRAAMTRTCWMMALGTAALGLCPSFASSGVIAPLVVNAARSSGLCRRRRHRELAIPRPQPGMWRRRVR